MKLLIKVFVTLGLLGLVLRLIDMAELKQSLLSIPLSNLAVVVSIFFFGQLLSSYKWWLLARYGASRRLGFWRLELISLACSSTVLAWAR